MHSTILKKKKFTKENKKSITKNEFYEYAVATQSAGVRFNERKRYIKNSFKIHY